MPIEGLEAVALYREVLGWDIKDLSLERPWTRDQADHLVELYERAYTLPAMAAELGRTNGYILGRLWDLADEGKVKPKMWGTKAKGQVPRGPLEVWA